MNQARMTLAGIALALSLPAAGAGGRAGGEAAASERGSRWIGAIVPPYPDGERETLGSCTGSVDAPGGVCGHALAVVDDAQSGLRSVLALRAAKHFGDGPLWQVVDALEPDALVDRTVEVAVATCRVDGDDDGDVLALVRPVAAEWLPALQAWRFDTTVGRLLDIPAASVRCRNEGFGYDG